MPLPRGSLTEKQINTSEECLKRNEKGKGGNSLKPKRK